MEIHKSAEASGLLRTVKCLHVKFLLDLELIAVHFKILILPENKLAPFTFQQLQNQIRAKAHHAI